MKSVMLFLIPGFLSLHVFAQQDTKQCFTFKTGLYAYRDDSSNAVLIKRTRTIQQETNKKNGVITRFKINWLSDCSYEIKQVWSNSKLRRKANGAITVVSIVRTGNDFYEYTCACKHLEKSAKNYGIVYRVP
jgi:hypothetical protein